MQVWLSSFYRTFTYIFAVINKTSDGVVRLVDFLFFILIIHVRFESLNFDLILDQMLSDTEFKSTLFHIFVDKRLNSRKGRR